MRQALITIRAVLDQAVVAKVRAGRLRDVGWPYGLRAVAVVGVALVVLGTALAVLAGPIRSTSVLSVPSTLTSSVPGELVWALVGLLGFCLALFTVAAVHGPWWMTALGIGALAMLLGLWSVPTTISGGLTVAVTLAAVTLLVVAVLVAVRRRRPPAWWEFPLVLAMIGSVLVLSTLGLARTDRLFGLSAGPAFLDVTMSLLTYLVLPAAFAAGAAVAEIVVGLTMVATGTAQRRAAGRWPYVVLAAMMLIRLAQEFRRLGDLDFVERGWLAILPAVALVGAFAGLGWLVSMSVPLGGAFVADLPDHLERIAVPIGACVIAVLLPVNVLLFGFTIAASAVPGRVEGFDPSPLLDGLVDGYRLVLGAVLVGSAVWAARRGRASLALVLGGVGLVVIALASRLVIGYRWAVWLDIDTLIMVVTVLVAVVAGSLIVRRRLSRERALGLAAVLLLGALLSVRSVLADPLGAVLGYTGVAFVLFGLAWDFLTGSDWANRDGARVRQPVRVLLALAYPLLTVTVVAGDALIRRPRTHSDVNAYAELGGVVLGVGLLGAAAVVVMSAVRGNRAVA